MRDILTRHMHQHHQNSWPERLLNVVGVRSRRAVSVKIHEGLSGLQNGIKTVCKSVAFSLSTICSLCPIIYRYAGKKLICSALTAFVYLSCTISCATAQEIDLSRIKQIESSGNPLAYNRHSQARGLYQITPICMKEFNLFNKTHYKASDLFNPAINERIAAWYLNVRIPAMLRHFSKPDTIHNRLVSYNAGISYVVSNKVLPAETKNYIKKYMGAI